MEMNCSESFFLERFILPPTSVSRMPAFPRKQTIIIVNKMFHTPQLRRGILLSFLSDEEDK